jgi:CRISPR-associated endoribonuclease Cas6
MRLVLRLECQDSKRLSINYNYSLASSIYNLLHFGSPEFTKFLHDAGYIYEHKTYKLFTFALKFENAIIRASVPAGKDSHFILKSPNAVLYISSPMIDTFIQNFVVGTFETQSLVINGDNTFARFKISSIESLPEIQITNRMKFSLLSPLVLSTKKNHNGQLKQYYLRPDDTDEINRVLTQNLINKYKLIYKNDIKTDNLSLEWDNDYLKSRERVTKKVSITKNGIPPVDIIGIQAPFTLTGNPELIKTGYECGFGEKNSMGFGLADTDFTD